MSLLSRVLGWHTAYRAWLIRLASRDDPLAGMSAVREVSFYWFLLMVPAGLACWLLRLDQFWRGAVILPTGAIMLGGHFYSSGVILWSFGRAQMRRLEERRRGRLVG
jgi:hypothetical protein